MNATTSSIPLALDTIPGIDPGPYDPGGPGSEPDFDPNPAPDPDPDPLDPQPVGPGIDPGFPAPSLPGGPSPFPA